MLIRQLIVSLILLLSLATIAMPGEEIRTPPACDLSDMSAQGECIAKATSSYEVLIEREVSRLKALFERPLAQADQLGASEREELRKYAEVRSKALDEAQRAWYAFREAKCAYEATESYGGSVARYDYLGCLMEVSRARYLELHGSGRNE